jgi:hypothetical protein
MDHPIGTDLCLEFSLHQRVCYLIALYNSGRLEEPLKFGYFGDRLLPWSIGFPS